MGKTEIETTLRLAQQYLKPNYNVNIDLQSQKDQEEGIFKQVISVLAKKDQDVIKIWNIIKKKKLPNENCSKL